VLPVTAGVLGMALLGAGGAGGARSVRRRRSAAHA